MTSTGRKPKKAKPKGVAIVGNCPNTQSGVARLFRDKSYEIWPLNQVYVTFPDLVPHATRWFNIHRSDRLIERDAHHLEFLAGLQIPVYMHDIHPDVPTSERFPKEKVLTLGREYFTSQIAWMFGLAILEGFKEIHIYGIDLATNDEYINQRPCLEYWIGFADGRGIQVYIPPNCDLCKSLYLYGYDFNAPFIDKCSLDKKWHNERINDCKIRLAKLIERRNRLIGALDVKLDTPGEEAAARRFIKESYHEERALESEMMQYVGMCSALTYLARTWAHHIQTDAVTNQLEEISSAQI